MARCAHILRWLGALQTPPHHCLCSDQREKENEGGQLTRANEIRGDVYCRFETTEIIRDHYFSRVVKVLKGVFQRSSLITPRHSLDTSSTIMPRGKSPIYRFLCLSVQPVPERRDGIIIDGCSYPFSSLGTDCKRQRQCYGPLVEPVEDSM